MEKKMYFWNMKNLKQGSIESSRYLKTEQVILMESSISKLVKQEKISKEEDETWNNILSNLNWCEINNNHEIIFRVDI